MMMMMIRKWMAVLIVSATTVVGWSISASAMQTPWCPGDVAPAGGNGIVNVDDLLAIINALGPCSGPCPPNCATDTNGDCVVNVNDLLTVINGWGTCPCPLGAFEPNDTCAQFTNLPNVGSNQTITISTAILQDSSDIDLYRIHAVETDSTCSCCDGFCTDEDFQLTVQLSVPASSNVSYQFCIGLSCADVAGACSIILPGQTGQQVVTFDGSCFGSADEYDLYVRVRAWNAGDTGCVPYELQYHFVPGCF